MKKNPVKVVSYRQMDNYPGAQKINTTSRSESPLFRQLSPFFLGPVDLYDNHTAINVENAWQYSKLYPEYAYDNDEVTHRYFEWAEQGWNKKRADRYPMGKGAKPICSYWAGEYLDYVEARKKIYGPLYAQAVLKTPAWAYLKNIHNDNRDFVLIDFDGYDYLELGMTLIDVINDPTRKMGHAFVLAMLLEYPELQERYGRRK